MPINPDTRRDGYRAEAESHALKEAVLGLDYLPRLLTGSSQPSGAGSTVPASVASTGGAHRVTVPSITRALVPKRPAGETEEAYTYRVQVLDPDGLFAYVTGSLAGQITTAAEKIARVWHPGEGDAEAGPFGDPTDPASDAHRLTRDANGEGHDWAFLWDVDAPARLTTFHSFYVFVDGSRTVDIPTGEVVTEEGGVVVQTVPVRLRPTVRLVPSTAVVQERYAGGICVARRLRETRPEADHLDADPVEITILTDFTLSGWTRYEQRGDDGEIQAVASGSYTYVTEAEDGTERPSLPLFRVDLGLPGDPAYGWARRCLARIAMRSGHDSYLHLGTFPRLHINDPSARTGTDGQVVGSIAAGGNVIETSHEGASVDYVEPAMTAATLAGETAETRRKEILREARMQADDAARQSTATEIRAQQNEGGGAFLSLVSVKLDEAENRALHLLAQALNPTAPTGWRAASVKRSREFVPHDEAERVSSLMDDAFGSNPKPFTTDQRVAIMERAATVQGLPFSQEEQRGAVEAWEARVRLASATGVLGGDGQAGDPPDLFGDDPLNPLGDAAEGSE